MGVTRDPSTGHIQYNSFASGAKRYGAGYGTAATSGQLSRDGYEERRRKALERQRALQRRIAMMGRGGGMVDPTQGGIQ